MKSTGSIALLCVLTVALAAAAHTGFAAPDAPVPLGATATSSSSEEHHANEREPRAHRDRTEPPAEREPFHPPGSAGFRLAGRVRDDDGAAVADATVSLTTLDGALVAAPSAVDPSGDFEWSDLPQRLFRVRAEARGVESEVTVAAPDDDVRLRLSLRAGLATAAVTVHVTDHSSAPVAGAVIEAIGDFSPPGPRHGIADDGGTCSLAGARRSSAVIVARTADGRVGSAVQGSGTCGVVRVTVDAPGTLRGAVEVEPSVSLPSGAVIVALLGEASLLQRGHTMRFETPIRDSSYRFDTLPAGVYTLSVAGIDDVGLVACAPAATHTTGACPSAEWSVPMRVEVTAGTSTRCDVRLPVGSVIEGHVRDELGFPLAEVTVACERLAPGRRSRHDARSHESMLETLQEPAGQPHPAFGRATRTDRSGRYRLAGLVPGPYRISARPPGRVAAEKWIRLAPGSGTQRIDFVSSPAGTVEGTVGHAAVVVLRGENGSDPRTQETDATGQFRFVGVAPGRHGLAVLDENARRRRGPTHDAPAPVLAEIDVVYGETTFADLRDALPITLFGRLLGDAACRDHTRVSIGDCESVVDAQGHFALRLASPVRANERLSLTQHGVTSTQPLPAAAIGARTSVVEIPVVRRSTTLRTFAACGLPIGAVVELSGAATGTVRVEPGRDVTIGLPPLPIAARIAFDDGTVAERMLDSEGLVPLIAPAGADVRVLVVDASGAPRRFVPVQVVTRVRATRAPDVFGLDDADEAIHGTTDVTGRATLRGVRAGDVLVRVDLAFDGHGSYAPERLSLVAGRTVDVRLAPR